MPESTVVTMAMRRVARSLRRNADTMFLPTINAAALAGELPGTIYPGTPEAYYTNHRRRRGQDDTRMDVEATPARPTAGGPATAGQQPVRRPRRNPPVTTRTGDTCYTDLIGENELPKYEASIEANGTLYEANSVLGLARASTRHQRLKQI